MFFKIDDIWGKKAQVKANILYLVWSFSASVFLIELSALIQRSFSVVLVRTELFCWEEHVCEAAYGPTHTLAVTICHSLHHQSSCLCAFLQAQCFSQQHLVMTTEGAELGTEDVSDLDVSDKETDRFCFTAICFRLTIWRRCSSNMHPLKLRSVSAQTGNLPSSIVFLELSYF